MLKAAFNRQRVGPTERGKLIAGIHAQAHALRLTDDMRRDLQLKLVGVESTKDMSLAQLSTVWSRLTALADDAGLKKPKRRPGRDERQPNELPTAEQCEKYRALYESLGIAQRPAVVNALCARITGKPWPQTREQANKLIEGLKAMVARGWRPRDVEPSEVDTVETGARSVASGTPADQAGGAGSKPAGRSNA